MLPVETIHCEPDRPLVAIGDVHGCASLLEKLLKKVTHRLRGKPFRTVFLGDYIDRGPDSRGVIDLLLNFRDEYPDTVFLKGNHEQAMLDFLAEPEETEAWLSWGGEETLLSYGIPMELPVDLPRLQQALASALPDAHFQFLMDLSLTHREGQFLFVHAGLNPDRGVGAQRESDLLWIRERFFRGGPDAFPDLTIVHGHTPVKRPEDHRWRVNVDTGAVWSSKLSAVIIDGQKKRFITT